MSRRRIREKKSVNDKITEGDINYMLHFFENRCCYCNVNLTREPKYDNSLHLDHYISLAEQDNNADEYDILEGLTLQNCVPSCRECNLKKNARSAEEFCREYIGSLEPIERIEFYFSQNQENLYV